MRAVQFWAVQEWISLPRPEPFELAALYRSSSYSNGTGETDFSTQLSTDGTSLFLAHFITQSTIPERQPWLIKKNVPEVD